MNKSKPSENSFKTAKNQEFELFTWCFFKKLISTKPMEQSVKSNSIEKFKVIVSTFNALLLSDFLKNTSLRKSSKPELENLILI